MANEETIKQNAKINFNHYYYLILIKNLLHDLFVRLQQKMKVLFPLAHEKSYSCCHVPPVVVVFRSSTEYTVLR